MKAAFILNPSQRWKKTPLPKLMPMIRSKIPVSMEFFTVDRTQTKSLEAQLDAVGREGFDTVILGGGDGTINRTINFLAHRNELGRYVLGVLPLGTCNDFAKTLGFRRGRTLRRNIQTAAEMLQKRHVRDMTVAQVNGHCFINNAGFGRRNPAQKKRGLLGELRALKPVPTSAHWGHQTQNGSFLMMIAANAPYFSNGLHFSNDSDPTDAQLEFFFVRDISKFRLFGKLFVGVRGAAMMRRAHDTAILKVKSPELRIRTDLPVWIMADGEIVPSLSEIKEAKFGLAGKVRFLTAK